MQTIGDTTGNGDEKEFVLDEKAQKLLANFNSPLQLLKASGKLGSKGAKAFFGISILVIALNVLFLVTALIVTAVTVFQKGLISLGLVLVTGIVFSLIIIKKVYSYAIVKAVEIIYQGIRPLFKKLCSSIINKVADELNKRKAAASFNAQALNIYTIYNDKLSILPCFVRKIFWFVIKRIPFVKFINTEVTDTILRGNKEKATELLYTKADDFIYQNIFNANNLKWLWLLLLINIVLQLVFIVIRL
ncbi:hypothetical protein [Flavobacterium rhizosphaerae]|uniref:ABC transmembrane type-1 domain-containing protein n=1 Tax=Flavobacterium rhizosphaerae TaxID=3163298 RepID=A0ABW8YUY4_9FLAO